MSSLSEQVLDKLLQVTFTSEFRPGYVTFENFVLPEYYTKYKKEIDDLEITDEDVWICGFPKTGTTWMAQMAWIIASDLDFQRAQEAHFSRVVQPDLIFLFGDEFKETYGNALEKCVKTRSPKFAKTHLPYNLIPTQLKNSEKKAKIIYTMRNPMDVCISYYYQCKNVEKFSGTLEDFCQLFLYDKMSLGPYWRHILSFWPHRNDKNILFLTYEDMKKDLRASIVKVAAFLNKSLTDAQISQLEQYLSFENMKTDQSFNLEEEALPKYLLENRKHMTAFFRKGKVGGYKEEMPPEYIPLFQKHVHEKFEANGVKF